MGRHREVRGSSTGRRSVPATRPRYKRLGAAGGALSVTLVAVLGGIGVLPAHQGSAVAAVGRPGHNHLEPDPKPRSSESSEADLRLTDAAPTAGAADQAVAPPLPADSGTGRRIVFAMAGQRVWLVGGSGDVVRRTYLVSGSVTDNLRPGTYSVYSKSMDAVGVDDSGTMRYMVRFAHGRNAAIGFHDIPELDGAKVQTRDQLGSPRSHGCIRQWRPDARALWEFAPLGTKVVVVA